MSFLTKMIRRFLRLDFGAEILWSLGLIVVAVLLRGIVLGTVRRTPWATDRIRLRWIVLVKRLFFLVLLLGLVIIWARELRQLAFSIAAVAVAFVLALKEIILCVMGAIFRASTHAFTVGDRIEMAGCRGDVVDYGLLGTTVLEIGPGHQRTGRCLSLPNSLFLTTPIVNETYTAAYVLHVIELPLRRQADYVKMEALLLQVAHQVCAPYFQPARVQMAKLAHEHGLSAPQVEPRVSIRLPDAEHLRLLLRVPVPAREKGRVEQEILRQVLRVDGT
ncbi:MAG: mechanosensitive ion channel domain-containing protein [Polyangiales bacterium]